MKKSKRPSLSRSAEFDPHGSVRSPVETVGEAGAQPHLPKLALAFVVKDQVPRAIGPDDDAGPAAVIVVGADHAHRLALVRGNPGLGAHIGERAVAVVAIQRDSRRERSRRGRRTSRGP